ncbi:MAG: hypothetical protein AB1716_13315 [Planctomycetota bacterium]
MLRASIHRGRGVSLGAGYLGLCLWAGAARAAPPEDPPVFLDRAPFHDLSISAGRFQRGCTGYRLAAGGMVAYPPGARRLTTVLTCSAPVDYEMPREEDNGREIAPWCANAAGLYASSTYPDRRRLLFSADGRTNWTTLWTFTKNIETMHVTQSGKLLAWIGDAPGPYSVQQSRDNGQTWLPCLELNAYGFPIGFLTNYASRPWTWAFHQAPHGTIIAGTYPYPSTTNQLWRSVDDGNSWQKVYELPPNAITHFHSICYHAGTDTWVADTGDGLWHWQTKLSVDDGRQWFDWQFPNVSPTGQVTRFRDMGHPTRLLVGSDGHLRAGWVDLTNWHVGTYALNQMEFQNAYFFDLFRHQGLWYGCHPDAAQPYQHSMLLTVSPDLEHWVPYARCPDRSVIKISGCVGFVGGKLHFLIHRDDYTRGHLCVSPARVAQRPGVMLSPASTNLLPAGLSTCDTLEGWSTVQNPNLLEVDPNNPLIPGARGSIHFRKSAMFPLQMAGIMQSVGTPLTVGRRYILHAWVKGAARGVRIYFSSNSYTSADYGLREDGWTEIWSGILNPYASYGNCAIIGALCRDVDHSVELWVGGLELLELPATNGWTPGESTSAPEQLDQVLTLGNEFTHIFSINLLSTTKELSAETSGLQYLRTYWAEDPNSGDDYVELAYNTVWERFELESYVNGQPTYVPASTLIRFLQRTAVAKFAVRYRSGELRLSISDGVATEHVPWPLIHTGTPLAGPDRCIRTGRHDGAGVLPCVLFDDFVYHEYMSDAAIDEVFALSTTSKYNLPGDCDGDNDVDIADFNEFESCLTGPGGELGPYCDCHDLDGDADVDLSDFVELQLSFGMSR